MLAVRDLVEAIRWLAERNPAAAQRMKDEIEQKVALLAERPRAYRPGRVPGTREMVVRPNHMVIYTESPQRIRVLRVLHAARNWPPA